MVKGNHIKPTTRIPVGADRRVRPLISLLFRADIALPRQTGESEGGGPPLHVVKIVKLIFLLIPFLTLACNDYDRDVDDSGVTTLSRRTDYGDDWIYFSLENGKEVAVAEDEHRENLDWDIAFNRYNIRTNSGIRENGMNGSGPGLGGAAKTRFTDFKAVRSVPDDLVFVVDSAYSITAPGVGMPPPTMMSTANRVLGEAITFLAPPPLYTTHPDVFIIRTAKGNYAKFQACGFHSIKGESGYYSFRFEMLTE